MAEATDEEFGQYKQKLLDEAINFMRLDSMLNEGVIRIVNAVAKSIEDDPKILGSSGNAELEQLIKEMRARSEKDGGKTGGDLIGGGVLSDIADFINAIGDFIKSEKEFIFNIIKLIICGCK